VVGAFFTYSQVNAVRNSALSYCIVSKLLSINISAINCIYHNIYIFEKDKNDLVALNTTISIYTTKHNQPTNQPKQQTMNPTFTLSYLPAYRAAPGYTQL
jgi:hypothetical protein